MKITKEHAPYHYEMYKYTIVIDEQVRATEILPDIDNIIDYVCHNGSFGPYIGVIHGRQCIYFEHSSLNEMRVFFYTTNETVVKVLHILNAILYIPGVTYTGE